MPKHLPPTAVPIRLSDLRRGLRPPTGVEARFRAALAGYLDTPACHLAASGRTALHLLLKSLAEQADHSARRDVLMPAYTCPALAKVALDLDLRPRLVDLSPHDMAFEAAHLEAQLSERTLAVICVHPFGIPQPVEPVLDLADRVGAVVVEDAAQSLGARLGGRPVGVQGHFGLFSLGPGKPLSTGGGGILCTNQASYIPLVERAWEALPPSSALASAWTLARLAVLALAFHPRGWWLATRVGLQRAGDREASWGYGLRRLSPAQAAVGLAQLERLDAINRRRRENARRMIACLQGLGFVHIPSPAAVPPCGAAVPPCGAAVPPCGAAVPPCGAAVPPCGAATAEPIYLRLPLLVSDEERRERLYHRLWAAGIGVGRMYRQPLSDIFPQVATESYPGASFIARHLLTLPTHHYLSDADMEQIASIFQAEDST
jgi:dTDP-4-amino-4,6-dideoxygalactose transaminase